MRSRLLLLGVGLVIALSCSFSHAEQEVILKTGTKLIGDVSLEGQTLNVRMGESELSFPLIDVEQIGPVGSNVASVNSPDRLLMIALESQLQNGTSEGLVGVLAEAYRLSPDDARIAYWYATSLLDAGFGSEANKVFSAHRQSVEQTYPGMGGRLATRIKERLALEDLPQTLIKSIDRFNAAAENQPLDTENIRMGVRFRLVDDNNKPLDKSSFRINCRGNNENLESFEDGHYLFTYVRYRNNSDSPCQLQVSAPGLKPKEIELHPTSDQVADAGDLIVEHFDESSKVPFVVIVRSRDRKPIENAKVTLQPETQGNNRETQLSGRTDAEGRATIRAFPLNYSYSVVAKGFKPESAHIDLKADSEEFRVALYPVISGTIRTAWRSTSLQPTGNTPAGATSSGESTLEIGEGITPSYSPDGGMFLRPIQVEDRLILQNGPPYQSVPTNGGVTSWVRRVPADELGESPLEFFTKLDLEKIDEMQDKFELPDIERSTAQRRYPSLAIKVKQGDVYIGKLPQRDPRNGQPTLVSFKVFVEKVSSEP